MEKESEERERDDGQAHYIIINRKAIKSSPKPKHKFYVAADNCF